MFCGIVDGLAFLPINSINTDINSLFKTMPNELFELLRFFDKTYISSQNDSKGRKHYKCLRGIGYAICFSYMRDNCCNREIYYKTYQLKNPYCI